MQNISEVAKAAKMIRQDLKTAFPNVKFNVTSRHYTTVSITWINGVTERDVNNLVRKYKMGNFNGMVDSYDFSNRRQDIPQAEYIFTNRQISTDVMSKMFNFVKSQYAAYTNASTINEYIRGAEYTAENFIRNLLNDQNLTNGCENYINQDV
jgi:hypothetical protein